MWRRCTERPLRLAACASLKLTQFTNLRARSPLLVTESFSACFVGLRSVLSPVGAGENAFVRRERSSVTTGLGLVLVVTHAISPGDVREFVVGFIVQSSVHGLAP